MTDNKHAEAVEALIRAEVGDSCYDDIRWLSNREIIERVAIAALNTRPDVEAMRETCAAFLEDEARGYRRAQANSATDPNKIYRMGQKDACLLAATAIRSIPVPTSGEGGDHG